MMSGAAWVRDRLQAGGWQVEIADARKVKGVASLAVKADKVDARVLAELCRRDLVPAVWLLTLEDRALKERLLAACTSFGCALRPGTESTAFSPSGPCSCPSRACVSPPGLSCSNDAGCRRCGGARWPKRWPSSTCSTSPSRVLSDEVCVVVVMRARCCVAVAA